MKMRLAFITSALCYLLSLSALAEDPPATPPAVKATGAPVTKPVKAVQPVAAANTSPSPAGPKSNDQLVLDATVVTGNRELPKVMYIVPWKKADLGNLPGQPFNTLLDETLMPVDREVFRREVQYYQVVSGKDLPAAGQATPKPDSK